jgi:hypothetical protein
MSTAQKTETLSADEYCRGLREAGVMGSETAHMKALRQWRDVRSGDAGYEWAEEVALLHHIPMGGARPASAAARIKKMGAVAGMPDLCLPVPRQTPRASGSREDGVSGALYLEMKVGSGRPSEDQEDRIAALEEAGNVCVVVYGWEQAVETIERYLKGEL